LVRKEVAMYFVGSKIILTENLYCNFYNEKKGGKREKRKVVR